MDAGNLRFEDLDGDHKISTGRTANNPGTGKFSAIPFLICSMYYLGCRLFRLHFSIFFQGTGNHYWYPTGNFAFWSPYSLGYCSFLEELR